jgi:D-alanine-D-alanine ligase
MHELHIGFTYDAEDDYRREFGPPDPPDAYAEFDSMETIRDIESSLELRGWRVERIGHVYRLLDALRAGRRWDLVFNIAEGLRGRNREAQVPLILEMFGVPFIGSDALTMALTLDKTMAKRVVASCGVPTPRFTVCSSPDAADDAGLRYPLFVKPAQEGTSKGIHDRSLVHDRDQLRDRVAEVVERYRQPALVEEFIAGRELTVVVTGNADSAAFPMTAHPPVEIGIRGVFDLGDLFYTHAMVFNDDVSYRCPAAVPDRLAQEVMRVAASACRALEIRDFGRVDVRVSDDGTPYFLECNPLPQLGKMDVFPLVAQAMGIEYHEIICRIADAARDRLGLDGCRRS